MSPRSFTMQRVGPFDGSALRSVFGVTAEPPRAGPLALGADPASDDAAIARLRARFGKWVGPVPSEADIQEVRSAMWSAEPDETLP